MKKNVAAFFDIDGTIYRNALLIEHFKKLIKYELFDDTQYRLKVEEAYNLWDTRKGDYDDYLLDLTQLYVVAIKGQLRSEERRVGKECRSRWSLYH